uniref:Uncharacterized protein LOC114349114 n=1 Tax=Diabrotica virgifera virgifera TaxID=50390 RepID=A0A6P7HCI3_DIAVI
MNYVILAGLNNLLIQRNIVDALAEAGILAERRGRVYHPFINPLEDYSDSQYKKLYRLTKPLTTELIEILEPHLTAPSRISALSISRKVLTTLRFLAAGSYQWDVVKNINHAISQTAVSKSIHEVVDALNHPEILNEYVHLPRNMEELRLLRD